MEKGKYPEVPFDSLIVNIQKIKEHILVDKIFKQKSSNNFIF